MKSQHIRLIDVFLLGPLMTWGGLQLSHRYPVAGGILAVSGVLTVIYNGRNYVRKELQDE